MKKILEKRVLDEKQLLNILGSGTSYSSEVEEAASDKPVISTSTNPRKDDHHGDWICTSCTIC